MKNIWTWVAVLLPGILIIAATPLIPPAAYDSAGTFPEWLIPVGYALAGLGAAGAFLAWVARKRAAEK